MNKNCCICLKDFRLPKEADDELLKKPTRLGLGTVGGITINNIELFYKWDIMPSKGFLCPECALWSLAAALKIHSRDGKPLCAGRLHGITVRIKDPKLGNQKDSP